VWLVVFGGAYLAGSAEAASRTARVSVVSERPWSVSRPLMVRLPVVLRITGWPSAGSGDKWRAPARIVYLDNSALEDPDLEPRIGQGLWLSGTGSVPMAGALITGPVEIRVPPAFTLPGAFDFRLFLGGRGLSWQGRIENWQRVTTHDAVATACDEFLHPAREWLLAGIVENLPDAEAKISAAILLGVRTPDSRVASRPFADLGLAHLFAVSGLHVGILLGIILLPGNIAGLSPWQKMVPLLVLLPLYVLLTGMPGSVMRAASLGLLAACAGALGRPVTSLRLIGLLFWAGTVWDPGQNLDMGLKLSYLAAGGILAVSSLTGGLKFSRHPVAGPVLTGLSVSAAAQWFTLPLVAGSFGRLSLLSPLANLVAVPVFGLAVWCVVLSLLLGPLWAFGGQAAGALGWVLLRGLSGLTNLAADLSAGFPVGLPPPGIGGITIWGLLTLIGLGAIHAGRQGHLRKWPSLAVTLGALTAGIVVFGPLAWSLKAPQKITAWQFDVGQGDCGLLVFPDGWTMMIDTAGLYGFHKTAREGPLSRNIAPFLIRHGVTRLDAVVLTHGHLDHTGGTRALEESLQVDNWLVSGRAGRSIPASVDSLRVHRARAGEIIHTWREWEVEIVFPPQKIPEDFHENDYSLVVVLRRAGQAMAVWSGDLESEGEQLLVGTGLAPAGVQVWKAGHHGSDTSGSREFMDILRPELILVSCGVGNGYGHPSHGPYVIGQDTVKVARTDLQGSLHLEWSQEGTLTWNSTVPAGNLVHHP
jgi:competence protein ComEC